MGPGRGSPHCAVNIPLIGLLASQADPGAIAPLVVALRKWSRPNAVDRALGAPDAYLAADSAAIGLDAALAGAAPVAVLIDSPSLIPEAVLERADVLVFRDAQSAEPFADRAVLFPRDHVSTAEHPSISPFVRSRWRERLGLPDPLIVRLGVLDPWPTDDQAVPAALATCSAAIVRGPWLLTALALGTPVITDASSAARIGATHNIHVVVASPTEPNARAVALSGDLPRATAIGWGGRLLIEERHDVGGVAISLLDALGIGPTGFPEAPLANLDAELAALGTPDTSSVAQRALRRAAAVAGPADWADLTGRRR